MATVGDIVVNLSANTQKFGADLNKGSSMLSGFAGMASKALGAAGIAFGLTSAVQSIIQNTEEAFKSERKLAAAIDATGGAAKRTVNQITALADARAQVTDFGDDATIAAAAILASFKTIQGQAFDRTLLAAQDMAAFFDTDLDQSVKTLGKVLADPLRGMTMLRKAGIQLTDQQKEQIRVFTQSGDVLKAQDVILKELESRYKGTAERTSSSWKRLWNEVGEGAEEAGKILAPPFSAITRGFTSMLRGARQTASFIANDFTKDVSMLFGSVGGVDQSFRKATGGVVDFTAALNESAEASDNAGRKFAAIKLNLPTVDVSAEVAATNEVRNLKDQIDLLKGNITEADLAGKKFFTENFGKMPFEKLERFRKQIVRFNEELTQAQKRKELGKQAMEFIQKAFGPKDDPDKSDAINRQPAGANQTAMRGSREAFSAIQAAMRGSSAQPINKVATNTAGILTEAQKQSVALIGIQTGLGNLGIIGL